MSQLLINCLCILGSFIVSYIVFMFTHPIYRKVKRLEISSAALKYEIEKLKFKIKKESDKNNTKT